MTELTFCPTCTGIAMPITAVVHACPNCKTTITEDIYAQRQQAIQNLAAGLDMPAGLLEGIPEGSGHYAHHMRPDDSCPANIADHGAPFAPAPCITKGDHSTHTGANGETWTDPPIGPDYNGDWPDPEPDDLTREQLAEIDPMWRAVAAPGIPIPTGMRDVYIPSPPIYDPAPVPKGTYVPELAALDRCEHGRHVADNCGSCPGRWSTGNLYLTPGQRIGTTLYGDPIIAPEHDQRGHSENWVEGEGRRIK